MASFHLPVAIGTSCTLSVLGKRKRSAPGTTNGDDDINPRPRKYAQRDPTDSKPSDGGLASKTEPLAAVSQDDKATAVKPDPVESPSAPKSLGKKRKLLDLRESNNDPEARSPKRRCVKRSDKTAKRARDLAEAMADPRHRANRGYRKMTKKKVMEQEVKRRPKFQRAKPRNPGNDCFFWEKHGETCPDVPPKRTGCQTWQQLRNRTHPVDQPRVDRVKPEGSPQVCDVGQLDLLKRSKLEGYPDYKPEVFKGYDFPRQQTYLQGARREMQEAKALYGQFPGVTEPGSMDTEAQVVDFGVQKSRALIDRSKRFRKKARPDPSGRKLLANKYVAGNKEAAAKAGVKEPEASHPGPGFWSNDKEAYLRALGML